MSVSETYWPTLKAILDQDPTAALRLDLQCEICLETMTVNDDDILCEPDDEAGLHHGAYIIPCGHIFGYKCASELMLHKRENRAHHSCPQCCDCLHSAMCECPLNQGTLLRVGADLQDAIHASVEKSREVVLWCHDCEMRFLLSSLWRIAFLGINFDDILQGLLIVGFTIRTSDKVWEYQSPSPDRRLIRQLEIPRELLEIFQWLGNFVASHHGLKKESGDQWEFEINLYEVSSEETFAEELALQERQLQVVRERLEHLEVIRYEQACLEAKDIVLMLGGHSFFGSPILGESDSESDADGAMGDLDALDSESDVEGFVDDLDALDDFTVG
ncbi:hypothetical protein NW762_001623 [Fusarium torreyae]|uniref:RING-type domain-containing protein n=1 Tax=Fusarium torreyae TaxID=1237075 RepID=A0A9W8SCV1_9HYPO|nr:hypothetical protein NW762_001623 [Fusarium torreyae]